MDNPELQAEHFARYVFDCGRADDPWGYANADFWNSGLADEPIASETKMAFNTVMTAAILKNEDSEERVKQLLEIQKAGWNATEPGELIDLFQQADKVCGRA